MRKFLLVGTCLVALGAFQAHASPQANAEQLNVGSVIGGLFGGVLGSTVGKGSGKLWATGAGAVLGTIVGSNLAGGTHVNNQPQRRTVVTVGQCNHIANDGARSSCERGVAERDRMAQRQAEQRAYECGRYGRCN